MTQCLRARGRAFAAAVPVLLLTATLRAQDMREMATPTSHLVLARVTPGAINNHVANGFRLVDLEYRGLDLFGSELFDATMMTWPGQFAPGWWWYFGLTNTQVSNLTASNSARLIDLEPYQDGNGNLRFACIMQSNTGPNATGWRWYYGTTVSYISSQISTHGLRLVDFDSYEYNGTTYYSAVSVDNTGQYARPWWWYANVTAAQITANINTNNARLYSLEKRSNGNFNCIMIRDAVNPGWYWWPQVQSNAIVPLLDNHGARALSLQSYLVGSTRYYAVLAINNSNALTTDVGNQMRATTTGQVGCWLQPLSGANLASLNAETPFEPASTIKTLHHVHAMRQVSTGAISFLAPINVFTQYSASNATCPVDVNPISEQLQVVLREMMENSDNARTQAITARFGQSAINATATALGMTSTSLNHRLGCHTEAVNNPNATTLSDLHDLHRRVANGYLGIMRATFYDLMLEALGGLSIDAIIDAEGAALSLPPTTIATFRDFTKLAHKGGNYILNPGGGTIYHRAEFGWLSLPFIENDVLTPREYTFGAFVNEATNDNNASAAIYQRAIPTLLRGEIRAALQSWTGSLAGVQSIGAGCGSPTYTQSVSALPRLGVSVDYRGINGFPNSLAMVGIGFSSSNWNGVLLPASLVSLGSEPGCFAYNNVLVLGVSVAGATGFARHSIAIPTDTSFLGSRFLTQWYTFNGTTFRTSDSMRSVVGL